VELEFFDCSKITSAYRQYIDFRNEPLPANNEGDQQRYFRRGENLLYDLLHEIGSDLGYRFDKDDLKRFSYAPGGWEDDNFRFRKNAGLITELLEGRIALPVTPMQPLAGNPFPPPPKINDDSRSNHHCGSTASGIDDCHLRVRYQFSASVLPNEGSAHVATRRNESHQYGRVALVHRILHPLVIVAVSLVIAGGALFSGFEIHSLLGDDASLLKLLGGAVFLVLIAIFLQQQTNILQNRHDLDRRYGQSSRDLNGMIGALRERTATDALSRRK
jgi:hypothetical protein